MKKNFAAPMRHSHIALACAGALAVGTIAGAFAVAPVPVYAETSAELQTKLDEAKSKLNDLFLTSQEATEKYEVAQSELDQLKTSIAENEAAIETKTAELKQSQETLSSRVHEDYKTGGISLTSMVLGSQNISDFVNRVMYASKINESDAKTISDVKTLKNELSNTKAELEQQKSDKEEKAAEAKSTKQKADAAASEMQNYVDSLDSQVQDALKAEQEAAAAEAAAQAVAYQAQNEAAAQAAQDTQAQSNAATTSNNNAAQSSSSNNSNTSNSSSNASSNNSSSGSSSSSSSNGSSSASTVSGGLTDAQRATILAAARSCIGTPYSYTGQRIPGVAIDCSGVTSYAYACAGLTIPRTSTDQRNASKIKPISQCKPGDLVFWYGHVAIYAGNGRIVHANYSGVEETNLYGSYLGGGNPFE